MDETVVYEDGVHVRCFREGDAEELREVFEEVWLTENRLYAALKVTRDELAPHWNTLLARARAQPWTCRVALLEGRLVSFSFSKDPFDDPVPAPVLGDSMSRIARLNDYLLQPLFNSPLFAALRAPRRVLYGLHGGTISGFTGHVLPGVGTISERLFASAMPSMLEQGFVALVGNPTHETTVERAFDRLDKGMCLLLARAPYATWEDIDGTRPFASITHLEAAFCELVVLNPSRLAELKPQKAKL